MQIEDESPQHDIAPYGDGHVDETINQNAHIELRRPRQAECPVLRKPTPNQHIFGGGENRNAAMSERLDYAYNAQRDMTADPAVVTEGITEARRTTTSASNQSATKMTMISSSRRQLGTEPSPHS